MPTSFDAVHIGARVVVRWRLDPPPHAMAGSPSMTDAVGELVARSEHDVTVSTSRGSVVIARDRIVAAKEIPPRPSRRGSAHLAISRADLQRVMGPSWGALEREPLGEWELRASRGFTQRGNSVLPIGDPGIPLADAIDRIEAWYAVRGLPAAVSLTGPVGFEPATDPLGAELLSRGWTAGSRTLNLTAATDRVAAADPGGPHVGVGETLDGAWLDAYQQSRAVVPDAAEGVLLGSPRQLFGRIALGGGLAQTLGLSTPGSRDPRPVAIGRLGLAHGWAGLGALWTDPAYRGRGLGSHLTAQLAATVRQGGIQLIHLQVEADNAPAIGIYERLGFERHSSYVYLARAERG
ncbi:GNAT family N-acetyltransferase [Knoellia sp. S7-12]|uniref:GNAT family N-acetyltransferase n=1 Tax=Knoellia sp. S7-12 TaxID=3126698 RepID=UPI003366D36B